jgi:GAF domain-containing protein
MGAVHLFDGKLVHIATLHNFPPEVVQVLHSMYLRPPQLDQASGRAILTRAVAQIEDMLADPQYTREVTVAGRWRSVLAVPMFRDNAPIGALVITRNEAGRFGDRHIELLKTFADQAVIAIENTRLFEQVQSRTNELARSVRELKSLSAVAQAVSSSLELNVVLARILEHACAMSDAAGGAIYVYERAHSQFHLEAGHNMSEELSAAVRDHPIRLGESVVAAPVGTDR